MNLTPIDVEQKAFTQALRGYQMDEVDDFLDEVVATLRSYEQRLREAQDKIRALESDTSSRGGDESEISRAIITAQRSADRLLAEAKAEAVVIRSQAEAETDAALQKRDEEKNRLQGEVSGMRDLVGSLRAKLSALAAAVASQVDQMEDDLTETSSGLGRSRVREEDTAGSAMTDDASATEDDSDDAAATEDDSDDASATEDDSDDAADDNPTFNDIFPGQEANELDITDDEFEPEPARVSARPWERG